MYLFDNELFAIECIAKYAMEGLDVKEGGVHDGYTDEFAHCPYPGPKGQRGYKAGDVGYYLTHEDHQHQGLLQSVDCDRCCFFNGFVDRWLKTKPPGYEELNVIYKKYISGKYHSKFSVPCPEEVKNKISETLSGRFLGALHPSSKAIIAIKPDGTKLYFGSVREAARELKMNHGNLSTVLSSGHVLTQGPHKGYQFFYAVKE